MHWTDLVNPLMIGPLLLLAAAARAAFVLFRRTRRARVDGEIVEWRGTDFLSPVIAFTTLDGREVVAQSLGAPDPLDHSLHTVPVWYDPAEPEEFTTQLGRFQVPGMVLAMLAAPCLLFDLAILVLN